MSERPNVVWIMSDQHNAKCTGWGRFPTHVHTPNLSRLAEDGVRFDRATVQNPICTPSRMSYLTGQYCKNHGYYNASTKNPETNHGKPNPHPPTLFSVCSELGYRTGAIGKIHTPEGVIEPDLDFLRVTASHEDSSYEEYLQEEGLADERDDVQLQEWVNMEGPEVQSRDARASRLPFEHQPEYWAVEQAKEFIEAGDDDPFCMWLSFNRPHQIYTPAERFWDMYPDEKIELPPNADEDLSDKPATQTQRRRFETAQHAVFEPKTYDALRRRNLRGYLGCVSMVDACVGLLIDYLEAEGLREDTIVIYCADHGDFAIEHGFLEKAPGISYDAITRVPFIWSWPGHFEQGEVNDELVESVDMFPTLVNLIADQSTASADGHDITSYLDGTNTEPVREYAVTENAWTKSIRSKDKKLTVYPSGFFSPEADEFLEFYDLDEDPWEMTNLAVDDPERDDIEHLWRQLYSFNVSRQRVVTTHNPSLDRPDPTQSKPATDDGTVDPRVIERYLARNHGDSYL